MPTPSLPVSKVAAALSSLPGWKVKRGALAKTFVFGSFREAFSFMARVAFEAEALNHHPAWSNTYNRLEIRLSTHDAGDKITAKDLKLARRIESLNWVD